LVDRHLARLAAAGVPDALVSEVADAMRRACAEPAPPTVVRFDVTPDGVRATPRPPRRTEPVSLVTVVGYEPGDPARGRERSGGWGAAPRDGAGAAAGADEALLVSPDGLVGETTIGNVFVVLADGTVATPEARGLLPGVTRSWVVEQTGARERPVHLQELHPARSMFVTSSGRGVAPVRSVAGTAIPDDP